MILLPISCKVIMNAVVQLCLRPVNVSAIVLNAFILSCRIKHYQSAMFHRRV